MKLRIPMLAALAALLLGAMPHRPAPLTVYSSPAGNRPAGSSPGHVTDAVLPDGRIAAPLGQSVFVGTNPLGVAVSPDGRYAIVSNDQQRTDIAGAPSPNLISGYSLAVVDTRTMHVVNVFHGDPVAFYVGVLALRDPANPSRTIVLASDGPGNLVRVFDLAGDGTLTLEPQGIAVPSFPASMHLSRDGRVAYVADNLGGNVTAIDVASRTALHTVAVGFLPFDVAAVGTHLYVTDEGLAHYAAVTRNAPPFAIPQGDPGRSSSLSIASLDRDGDLNADPSAVASVRMDQMPDGIDTVGSARPGSIVARRDGRYAYVSLANVDRVATLDFSGDPHVVSGLDLRLFVDAPYGTQPSAEVLSTDGKHLYVALSGINAVAVLDASHPPQLHRLGLIPTGAFPAALALSPDGHYLYIADAKGVDGWGILQRVDLRKMPLVRATLSALRYNRTAHPAVPNGVVPPLRSKRHSNVIDRVVYISVGTDTFDAMLGDLKGTDGAAHGDGDPSLSVYPENVTPNLHALARTYALADNFFASDLNLDANRQVALTGVTTLYTQRTMDVNAGRAPFDAHGEDPENYPRAGYLFNTLARAQAGFRDYGGLVQLSGYTETTPRPTAKSAAAAIDGLGGTYTLDVPALAALDGHLDTEYPTWNPYVSDRDRAARFVDDMDRLVRADQMPAFTYIWLPTVAGSDGAADADRALGTIVAYLSRTPHWSSTAVFVVPDGIRNGRDHVNGSRSYALLVSPLAKAGYVGHAHLSMASVLKTEEELLGLPPLALNDLLATDMADFFSTVPYPSPYQAIP